MYKYIPLSSQIMITTFISCIVTTIRKDKTSFTTIPLDDVILHHTFLHTFFMLIFCLDVLILAMHHFSLNLSHNDNPVIIYTYVRCLCTCFSVFVCNVHVCVFVCTCAHVVVCGKPYIEA